MEDRAGAVTEDRVLGGRVVLFQPARGYRAGLDAALLAAACDPRPGARVLDLGCGAGAAMLAAAARRPDLRFVGLERDDQALALARRAIAANGLEDRVEALAGDVSEPTLAPGAFDGAICNPPYHDDPAALRAPHPARRGAYLAEAGLGAWTALLLRAVRNGAPIVVIHQAARLAHLLELLGAGAGSFQVRPVHPFADAPAGRVLVRAVRGGRAPLKLLPPLVLHVRDGPQHTAQAEAILRGEADLPWR